MASSEREEEILSVRSIYCDANNTFEVIDETHFTFRSVPIVLSIMLPPSYPDPSCPPEISVDSAGLGVSRLQTFQLHMQLEAIIQNKRDEPVLFDLTEETREFTEGLRDDVKVALVEEDEEEEDLWTEEDLDKRIGDLKIVESHMGSVTIQSIMKKLPPTTKLLHAEIVLRSDLRKRYLDHRIKIQQVATRGISDRRARDAAWDKYGREDVVFHGTPRHNVGSIVKSGFIVPGQKTAEGEKVSIRCGSTWGMGIYTSPDPEVSLSYTDYTSSGEKGRRRLLPGQKLIVSSIVMGRRCQLSTERRLNDEVVEGFDSHVSPSQLEYIVFNSAQVLPLFVLHIAEGRYAEEYSAIGQQSIGPERFYPEGSLTDYARKHLPNGFGSASGHRFTVLAIGPVDDDEEYWGEFQHDGSDKKGEFQEERWLRHWSQR